MRRKKLVLLARPVPTSAEKVTNDTLALYGADDRIFESSRDLTEENLNRLYDVPMRIVEVDAAQGGKTVSSTIAVFSAWIPA